MTRKPLPISSFEDIRSVLDTCLSANKWPAIVECKTAGAARNWTHRANTFRATLRKMDEEARKLPLGHGTTQYDHLVFRPFANEVKIEPRTAAGIILRIDNEVINPDQSVEGAIDDLDEED